MTPHSRRTFISLVGATFASSILPLQRISAATEQSGKFKFHFGMASYSLRSFTLDQTIEMTNRLNLKFLTLKDMHLPMQLSDQELKSAIQKISSAGLTLDSLGVIYMKSEEEIRQAFNYARSAGVKMIIGAPDEQLLPIAEKYVKETDISLAIHNHGPDRPLYSSPEDGYKAISRLDKRIGLCIDIGHTQRLGLDPSIEFEKYFDRVLDVHIKDVDFAEKKGKTVEIGRGIIDIPKFLSTAMRLQYANTMHFEFEKDQKDPLPGMAESVGFVNGVLSTMK